MKIVCVMPIFERPAITIETIELMKKQTYQLAEIIVVGSCKTDEEVAKKTGVEYLYHKNEPLSAKWQAAVCHAEKFDPDAVLINGSDSWLSTNWCKIAKQYIEEGFHLVGKTDFYSCRVNPKEKLKIINKTYKKHREDPVGAGRLFSREAIELLNWVLYPKKSSTGLDKLSFDLLISKTKNKNKIKIINKYKDLIVMGVKSNRWPTLSPFRDIKSNKYIKGQIVNDPTRWVEKHFPGSLKIFKELVPGVKI